MNDRGRVVGSYRDREREREGRMRFEKGGAPASLDGSRPELAEIAEGGARLDNGNNGRQ